MARNCSVPANFTQPKSYHNIDFKLARRGPNSHLQELRDPGVLRIRRDIMTKIHWVLSVLVLVVIVLCVTVAQDSTAQRVIRKPSPTFELDVLVNGRPVAEYYARGRTYIEAIQGAEYELRVHNPSADRVAVALSVDGLNTIDARHTTAWNASKWVIEPYQTITIGGWQMSSARARRFYFTTERDSYGAKLGQTANLGVISAAFFLEKRPAITAVPPRPIYRDDQTGESRSSEPVSPSAKSEASRDKAGVVSQAPNDEFAATGIGRSVDNDVRWINMELESSAAAEVNIRYEYYSALLRLGVVP